MGAEVKNSSAGKKKTKNQGTVTRRERSLHMKYRRMSRRESERGGIQEAAAVLSQR